MKKSVLITAPSQIPSKEHWAIIDGSTVHHEDVGVWAPGHGYPAHDEKVISYEAFFNERDFIEELERCYKGPFERKVIGIHVDKLYTKQTSVKVVESKLGS